MTGKEHEEHLTQRFIKDPELRKKVKGSLKKAAKHEHADFMSAESMLSTNVIGNIILPIAKQCELVFGFTMIRSVASLCGICSIPFVLRTWYSAKGKLPMRISITVVAFFVTFNTIFQFTRGTAASDSNGESAAVVGASFAFPLMDVIPELMPTASFRWTPFRPIHRKNKVKRHYEVRVRLPPCRKCKHHDPRVRLYVESMQKESKAF